jgi:predicted GIY-YIG superfamily endonuclease
MQRQHPHINSGVYALRLEHGKFYVGASKDIDRRISNHKSEWTQIHKPKSLDNVFPAKHNLKDLEREVTLMYMREHGWEDVRGAGWTRVDMQNEPKPLREPITA